MPCSVQRQAFDTEAWASDYFQLASGKVQAQLTQYLLLPDVQGAMPPSIKDAAKDEQLVWVTNRAVQDLSLFADTQLSQLAGCDITSGHQDPETAATIVNEFRSGISHDLEQWADASVALANIKAVFTALGLIECEIDSASVITAILAAKDKAAGKQERGHEEYEQTASLLHDQVRAML